MVNSVNFVVLGDYGIAGELGKKGTATDIAIYDRKTADVIYTWTTPTTFPDKIQPLMQAIGIAEYAILNVTKLDKYLGEQVLALDSVGFQDGFILHSYEIDEEKLKAIVKNTPVSNFKFIENVEQLKEEIAKLKPKGIEGPTVIPVDHVFDVKGVGTVALGVVKQGSVKVHDELALLPSGKNILVKSIQMHDDSVEDSKSPARVGLAIKGANADDISRGDVICQRGAVKVSAGPLSVKFTKSGFFKEELSETQLYMVSIGLQIRPSKIKQAGEFLQMAIEKPVAYKLGQSCALLKPDSPGTRIVGKGTIQ